jgi:hypothetical protein
VKNTQPLRYTLILRHCLAERSLAGQARARRPSQRTGMYASFLMISRAVHLDVFERPGEKYFFKNL